MTAQKTVKEKGPSHIELTTFALYKLEGQGGSARVSPLSGAFDAKIEDGKIELLAGNAPFHSDAFAGREPKPGHGLLMLYGIRDTVDELYKWRAKARELNAGFAFAYVRVEVGHIEVGLTNRERLHHYGTVDADRRYPSRFLNVRRMTRDLQTDIHKHFQKFSDREPGTTKADMEKLAQIALRPDYFDLLFQEDKDFHKHLDVLVIPVADDPESPDRVRQLAYVRPGAKIVEVTQGSDQASIVLPRWMTDVKFAKKLRQEPQAI